MMDFLSKMMNYLQSLSAAELNGSVTDLILASDSQGAAIVLKVLLLF